VAAPAFDALVVFGDSLSDGGNAGRFSNGPVWVEQLATRLGVALRPHRAGGTNFAVGGARLDPRSGSDSVRAQADRFLKLPQPTGRILHVVYGGGNDLLGAVGRPDAAAAVERAVSSASSIVRDLAERGATDILVPNLPDVGITPAIRAGGAGATAEARRLTETFNVGLDGALAKVRGTAQLRLHRLDVWSLAEGTRADPAAHGFVDISTPCSGRRTCDGHLFWDNVHPTAQAHGRLADAAYNLLPP
jgi:outer membrane lipase/esterase